MPSATATHASKENAGQKRKNRKSSKKNAAAAIAAVTVVKTAGPLSDSTSAQLNSPARSPVKEHELVLTPVELEAENLDAVVAATEESTIQTTNAIVEEICANPVCAPLEETAISIDANLAVVVAPEVVAAAEVEPSVAAVAIEPATTEPLMASPVMPAPVEEESVEERVLAPVEEEAVTALKEEEEVEEEASPMAPPAQEVVETPAPVVASVVVTVQKVEESKLESPPKLSAKALRKIAEKKEMERCAFILFGGKGNYRKAVDSLARHYMEEK